MHFSDNLDRLARHHELDNQTLAEQTGLSQGRIYELRKGGQPSVAELEKLAGTFKVTMDKLWKDEILPLNGEDIRMLVLDVDGVLTDGSMNVTETGDSFKRFNTHDGRGIVELLRAGTEVAILSGSSVREAIHHRAKQLGVKRVYVGKQDKLEVLKGWLEEMSMDLSQVAYIGDDLNDLSIIPHVGISACPADACEEVRKTADIILKKEGGKGCVREFIEMLWNDRLG